MQRLSLVAVVVELDAIVVDRQRHGRWMSVPATEQTTKRRTGERERRERDAAANTMRSRSRSWLLGVGRACVRACERGSPESSQPTGQRASECAMLSVRAGEIAEPLQPLQRDDDAAAAASSRWRNRVRLQCVAHQRALGVAALVLLLSVLLVQLYLHFYAHWCLMRATTLDGSFR